MVKMFTGNMEDLDGFSNALKNGFDLMSEMSDELKKYREAFDAMLKYNIRASCQEGKGYAAVYSLQWEVEPGKTVMVGSWAVSGDTVLDAILHLRDHILETIEKLKGPQL